MSRWDNRLSRLTLAGLPLEPLALVRQARQGSPAGFAERVADLVDDLTERLGAQAADAVAVAALALMSESEQAAVCDREDPDASARIRALSDAELETLADEGRAALRKAHAVLGM